MRSILLTTAVALAFFLPIAAGAQETDGPISTPVPDLAQAGPLGEKALGDPDAPVTMIEYASLTCNHCGSFYTNTFGVLKEKYIDTGKVYFILREYPLEQRALAAAMTARCAPEENYFAIIDTMFVEQASWAYVDDPVSALVALLAPYGVTRDSFNACLQDTSIAEGIMEVAQRGHELGVTGTPAFFINGEKHSGAMSIEQIDAIVAPLLSATPSD